MGGVLTILFNALSILISNRYYINLNFKCISSKRPLNNNNTGINICYKISLLTSWIDVKL